MREEEDEKYTTDADDLGNHEESESDEEEDKEEKLTDWKYPPSLQDLKKDYNEAKPDHDAQIAKIQYWLNNLNIQGGAKPKKINGKSSIQPKLIRKQAEWRYSSLSEPFLSTVDLFNADPVTFEDKKSAIQNGLVLNNQFNTKIQKVKFINDYVRAAVDEGTVITRVGWDYQEEIVKEKVPEFEYVISNDPQVIAMHQQLHQLMQQDIAKYKLETPKEMQIAHELTMANQQPIVPKLVGSSIKEVTKVLVNQPTVEVCDSYNVIIDPIALGDIDKAGFVIFSFETSLSELKKQNKYKNLDKINIGNMSLLGEPDHRFDNNRDRIQPSFNFSDDSRKKFVAYEYWGYWDIDGSGVTEPIVAVWAGDVLIRLELNPFPDKKIPFVISQYLPIRRSMYGEPDGELLEDNQKIIGAVTRGMIDIMGRSANGQVGIRKDALDLSNKRKFDNGQDYLFNPQVDPRQAVFMHTYPEVPASALNMLALQNQEAESLTGVKAFSSGISGNALGDTATGIRSALDATSKRELDILRRLAQGIINIGKKFVSMNREFLSELEVIRITNDEFVQIRRDDLVGDIDLTLTISTPEADNEKAQELAFMLQTTAQSMGQEFTQIILADIAKLRKMPELSKKILDFTPKPDPLQEQLKQLEIEKVKAEIQKLQSQAAENMASAKLDIARVPVEDAKANITQSKADLHDLDYVEQESGTKHARDVDRITSQADAQTKTKIVDNLLKGKASN